MPTRTAWPGGPAAAADITKINAADAPSSRARPGFMKSGRTRSADRGGDGGAEILRAGIAAEIGGAGTALGEDLCDRSLDGGCRVGLAEMVEHHRARPDLADRVGDAAPRDVRRRAVHRLEHRGVFALGVDVAGRRDAVRADAGGPEIGQDVAEQ